ncbi:hypothetical protein KI387_015580 [Taxus chinensis]|uniref:Phospholipid:diacylglycerol acyltransferase n=1 Tax=Taxus chinensis TaxID=29808 RepID=A0AA38GD06_TAXCH|nr:hypothetical protein KI387_015580 [Taxus chinensis]
MRWMGPYLIVEVYDNGTIQLLPIDGERKVMLVNGHRLRLYHKLASRQEFQRAIQEDLDLHCVGKWLKFQQSYSPSSTSNRPSKRHRTSHTDPVIPESLEEKPLTEEEHEVAKAIQTFISTPPESPTEPTLPPIPEEGLVRDKSKAPIEEGEPSSLDLGTLLPNVLSLSKVQFELQMAQERNCKHYWTRRMPLFPNNYLLKKNRFRNCIVWQTLQHVMRMTRTWDATMSMLPKGGETIWGDLDWSPEEGDDCHLKRERQDEGHDITNSSTETPSPGGKPLAHYGRIISFGKDAAELPSAEIEMRDYKAASEYNSLINSNVSCGDVWTEYHDMSWESIKAIADHKLYTAGSIIDLLHYVAPKMMQRGDAHFSYGIADNLDDPKYKHPKYWSNPLETKLPNAPDMEIFSLYGVGIPTERSYVYKLLPHADTCYIPFQIDGSAEGGNAGSCLKGGVYLAEGDETVPSLSAGFMCAKAWRGQTRFNPSGMATYIREYLHAPPANLLEGRGTQSGAHVDIMGNFALIEDIIRVAAGAKGKDIGGDQVYSEIYKWSEKIKLKL